MRPVGCWRTRRAIFSGCLERDPAQNSGEDENQSHFRHSAYIRPIWSSIKDSHCLNRRGVLDGRSRDPTTACGQRFLLEPFREELRFRDDFRDGTLPPFSRASLSPIAIACLRLVTFRPDRPLFKVPFFRRRIADSTFFEADRPYFAMYTPPCAHSASCVLEKAGWDRPSRNGGPAVIAADESSARLEQNREIDDHLSTQVVDDRVPIDDSALVSPGKHRELAFDRG